jgi:hypothetical protein
MAIIKDTSNSSIEESARFNGAGIVVEVRANDRGKLDSPENPAHAHVLDRSGGHELTEIILTRNPPKNPLDVFYYRTDIVPDGLSKAIVKFAGMSYAGTKRTGLNLTNWQAIVTQWIFFHGN